MSVGKERSEQVTLEHTKAALSVLTRHVAKTSVSIFLPFFATENTRRTLMINLISLLNHRK